VGAAGRPPARDGHGPAGRGSSGDADTYSLSSEYADVAAVAAALASEQGGPADVIGHSIGATCVLGAAAGGAPFRCIVLYEPDLHAH
jgi:pimeloyl-ACP methyl ester carboxylesterase